MLESSVLGKGLWAILVLAVACSSDSSDPTDENAAKGGAAAGGTAGAATTTLAGGGTSGTGGTSPAAGDAAGTGGTSPAAGSAAAGTGATSPATGGTAAGTAGSSPGTAGSSPGKPPGDANCAESELIAFPCADGYGKKSLGGRGGNVYEVTTLNPSGPGSLGAAINASGPRTVVFKVAGNIEGSFSINNDFITIAGQSAPGDGVCIKGNLSIRASDVIVRYIRVRPNATGDAITGGGGSSRVILDHISASWSGDEVLSVYGGDNTTFQYCMISEAASSDHRFGGIWGNDYGSYHHNLFAHNASRTPRWASPGSGHNDHRNNVIYNWGHNSSYGASGRDTINMVANYYKPGPATESGVIDRIVDPNSGSWYVAENVVVGSETVTNDNWLGVTGGTRLTGPWDAMPIRQQTAEQAYETVLRQVGCVLPKRDSVDARIVEEVRNGTATYGSNGFITRPADVGGWPELASGTPSEDSDHDGMPDSWETANGLNPNDPEDRNRTDAVGWTMLENFLNSIDSF